MSAPTTILTEEMRNLTIGVEGLSITADVEQGAIIKFARAIGDDNPLFNDEASARGTQYGGLIAPPTFLRSIGLRRPEPPFDLPFTRLLDGGSDWEYFHPVRGGDRITAVGKITDIVERTGRLGVMVIMTVVATYHNQFDQVVATQTNTSIRY